MTEKEATSQNPKEQNPKEPCPECTLNTGVAIVFRICELANAKCDDVKVQLFDGKIDVQEAIDTVKSRLAKDSFHTGLVEEVEQVMRSQMEKFSRCISLPVKQKMGDQIDEWVEDRKLALAGADPNSKFAEGTKELIENLKKSKETIESLPTCEERG
jgi:hypothetical protein